MKHILLIASNDLRLFFKEKASWFWLFIAPLLFAFFMGMNRGPGDPSSPRPALLLENKDSGFLGKIFIEELGVQGLRILTPGGSETAERGLRIPADFTAQIAARKPVKLQFFSLKDSPTEAAFLIQARVTRALVALNGHLLEQSGEPELTENSLRKVMAKPDPIMLESSFGSRKPLPAGYSQSVPGVLVMFVLMNLLIFGGTSVASERREGVLRRFMVHPVSRVELVFGKIAGLLGLGLAQIAYMLIVAMLVMKFRVGSALPLVLLLLAVYGWAAGSLGVLIGSVVQREDKIVGICVLFTLVLAALGGCWWPLEIVPDKVQFVAFLTPVAWAMHGLHQLISFGGGLREILPALGALSIFGAIANLAAMRCFRV
jgi:ABC-type multidrug transport system permease subunit